MITLRRKFLLITKQKNTLSLRMGGQIDCQPKYPAINWACGVIDTTLFRLISIALVLLGTACAAGCVIDRSTDRLLLQCFEELFFVVLLSFFLVGFCSVCGCCCCWCCFANRLQKLEIITNRLGKDVQTYRLI